MKQIGPKKTVIPIITPADQVGTVIMTTGSVPVAAAFPTGAHFYRVTPGVRTYFNPVSTSAAIPTTNAVGESTQDATVMINPEHERFFYVAGSTGYSLAGETSGLATIEFWREGS